MIKTLQLFIILSLFFISQIHAQTRIIALDVKEGQSVLIQHFTNGWLIDTGHPGQSVNILDKLRRYGVENIEGIILTHLHPDHASGYFRLKEKFPSAKIFSNCHPLPENIQPDITRWTHEALLHDQQHQCLSANDNILFYDFRMMILWPYKFINNNLNHHSLVINIAIDDSNILVMGDADRQAEEELLSRKTLPTDISTLIVGHHGANDASSTAFLQYVKPETAIISTNKDNIRGYPSRSTIERLNQAGAIIQQTSLHGDIIIPLDFIKHEKGIKQE